MALSKLKLQQLREVCQEQDIDYSGIRRQKDLIELINEIRETGQAAVDDDEGEDEVEFGEDVASVASESVSQNGDSSDQIEIAAVTRSRSRQESDVGDGNTASITLSAEKNRMLRDMDMTKFKEIEEPDVSLQALFSKAKQNDSRYCISNDLRKKQ